MTRLDTPGDVAVAVGRLIAVEPRFGRVVDRHGLPPLRHNEAGLKSLLRIVTDQLISLKAGEAIWRRLAQRLDPFEPDSVLECPQAELREMGLSGAKARTFHACAEAFRNGTFEGAGNAFTSDEDLLRSLTRIPGIGPWTAHVYLLTSLSSADAWPAADLALQRAATDLLTLPARPNVREMISLAEAWRPNRSAAALLLWSHYRGLNEMPQA